MINHFKYLTVFRRNFQSLITNSKEESMAQFTTHGRLKLLFNGEVGSSILEHNKGPFHYKCSRSALTRKRRPTRYMGSSAGGILRYATSSMRNKANRCNAEARFTAGNEGVHDEYEYDSDGVEDFDYEDDVFGFDGDGLSCFRGLVLDLAYRPVNVVCWKRAICLEFMEKADVLEYYEKTVNSPSGSFYIPAVLRVPHLLQVVKRRIVKNNLSRKNILFRDHFTCQYCSSRENLTIDHVVPAALGGEWTWENLIRVHWHSKEALIGKLRRF
uniref:HNH nuclease domain-containing protein n=1 Tax=Lotus japonicus TaxID=34305 RepID=I3T8T8_LOTJA|nr:unknown [Lotus japonicus]